MNKKNILLLFLLLLSYIVKSQSVQGDNKIFLTQQDFVEGKGIPFETVKDFLFSGNNQTVFFIVDGMRKGYNFKKMYAFRFKNKIFRFSLKMSDAVCLVNYGKVCYWENGAAYITMLIHDTNEGYLAGGNTSFLSNDLLDEILPIPNNPRSRDYPEFRAEFVKHSKLIECLAEGGFYPAYRKCVSDYNSK